MLGDLRRIAESIAGVRHGQRAAGRLADQLSQLLNGAPVGVVLHHEEEATSVALAPAGRPAHGADSAAEALRHAFGELSGIDAGTPTTRGAGPAPPDLVPVMVGDRVTGLLAVFESGVARAVASEHILFLLAELLGPVLAARAELLPLAHRDPLTGLYNRRWLQGELARVLALAHRRRQEAGFILADIDGFKRVNDTLGHGEGDRLLVEVARALARGIRREDGLCRYGGDEFVVVLPQTGMADTQRVARRLVAAVAGLSLPGAEDSLRISLSFGTAMSGTGGATCSEAELIERADETLVRAKRAARTG